MKKNIRIKGAAFMAAAFTVAAFTAVSAKGYEELLKKYEAEAGQPFDAAAGKALYEKKVNGKSCTDCHNTDIRKPGQVKFLFLSKTLDPFALSANPKAFSDAAHADKDFNKNCKKIFGRVCTAKEKGDMLQYFISN